jgi:hypothetical protein
MKLKIETIDELYLKENQELKNQIELMKGNFQDM